MLFRKKNILFLLCPEKNILALRLLKKKFSGFLSEENKKKILRKTPSTPPPSPLENQMVGPLSERYRTNGPLVF